MRDDKRWSNFPLTRAAVTAGDPAEDETDQPEGNPLLRELMHASGGMRIAPGVYYASKLGRTPPAS